MKYLIATEVICQDSYSEVDYAVLEVDQGLIDRLKKYQSIVRANPEIVSANFREACFTFTKADLANKFPELKLDKEDFGTRPTNIDLSQEVLGSLDLDPYEDYMVEVGSSNNLFSFSAMEKHNCSEVRFDLFLDEIEAAWHAKKEKL